jgi:uncharacterized protein (DUF1330 family)
VTAFFIATAKIKNAEKMQAYARAAAATFPAYGGELVLRGKAIAPLAGANDDETAGIVKFPDADALARWYKSSEYQSIIPLREEAADMTIVAYAVP